MDGSMRRKIESVYGSLRPSERKAADYLRGHPISIQPQD